MGKVPPWVLVLEPFYSLCMFFLRRAEVTVQPAKGEELVQWQVDMSKEPRHKTGDQVAGHIDCVWGSRDVVGMVGSCTPMKERSALSCPVTLIHIPRCMDVTIRPSCTGGCYYNGCL